MNYERQQKEMFDKNQRIIDNFAKFEDDLFEFENEITSMINPVVEKNVFDATLGTNAFGGKQSAVGDSKKHNAAVDIDKLLADLKVQGEKVLEKAKKEEGGNKTGTAGEDSINKMFLDIDNEFSEIDSLLKDVETLTRDEQ